MYTLTRIFLHNWHRFRHQVLDVDGSLYLAGHNGSGKSSVLDALQAVLIADQTQMRFNSAASERSKRSLHSYIHGALGESRLLRPGKTVSYVALEFSDVAARTHFTLAVCMESEKDRPVERIFAILPQALDPQFFAPHGQALTRRALREAVQAGRTGKLYETVGEYRDDLLTRLGFLNPRFFDLFLQALTFQPIRNIAEFVEKWLLRPKPLQLDTLRQVVEDLERLRALATSVRTRLDALEKIAEQGAQVARLGKRHDEYRVLCGLLALEVACQRRARRQSLLDEAGLRLNAAAAEYHRAAACRKGAQQAYDDARERLLSSDAHRRRTALREDLARVRTELARAQSTWQEVAAALKAEARVLVRILEEVETEPEAASPIRACVALIDDSGGDAGEVELVSALEEAGRALSTAASRARQDQAAIDHEVASLAKRAKECTEALRGLRQYGGRHLSAAVERLRDQIAEHLGSRPPLLCERLEVPDERWQDAAESVLGQRRFAIVVPTEHGEQAVALLDQARRQDSLYEVEVLALPMRPEPVLSVHPSSIALHIEAAEPDVRAYIDAILGQVVACDDVAALRLHAYGVTADAVIRRDWTVRVADPSRYRPWYVGRRATHSQIEAFERELSQIEVEQGRLKAALQCAMHRVQVLDRASHLVRLEERVKQRPELAPLRARLANLEAELASLDTTGLAALEQEVARLKALTTEQEALAERALREQERASAAKQQAEKELSGAVQELREQEAAVDRLCALYPEAVDAARQSLAERKGVDPTEALLNAERAAARFATSKDGAVDAYKQAALHYNIRYQFGGRPDDPEDSAYVQEQQRLRDTELAGYDADIERTQRMAEDELREHILHELHQHLLGAQYDLERINVALRTLDFHDERYRFISTPTEEVEEFYRLIMDSGQQLGGTGSLFTSTFYADHKEVFDRFYELLTRTPQSDAERVQRDRLIDYRRYLTYDIKVLHANGEESRLSRYMNQTSGGESQTPFYVTIAASFVQLYRGEARSQRNGAIALVAFDEAFSKMDQERIGATLELFKRFRLQVITATPLERCEYLVPKMQTNLVLTVVGDTVQVEPYANFAAAQEDDGI